MSHEPFGNRWAGAPQTARGRKLQEHHIVLRQLRREVEEPRAGPPAADDLTHTELLRSRNAACMRVASITSSSDDPLEPSVRLRRSSDLKQRPQATPQHTKRAWDMVRGTLVGDKDESEPGVSELPAQDTRSQVSQSIQLPHNSCRHAAGDENVPPWRLRAKHPSGAQASTGASRTDSQRATRAELMTRAELVEARRMLYTTQEVGIAQPERFSGCLTDCAPLSRLLLRGLPAGSAQQRYEELRLGPGEAFDAYPPLPMPSPASCAAASEDADWWRELT